MTGRGMIHGRFQPFHNGHLEYLAGAAERSGEVFVGITNPDPARIKPEPSDPLRHLPESNPWSYADRLLMVKAAAADLGLDPARVHVIPFPVNEPELWAAYVPDGVTQYIRLFSEWGGTKLDRLRRPATTSSCSTRGSRRASRARPCAPRFVTAATGSRSCPRASRG